MLSREQVRAFDKHAIEQLGIPAAVLMENAGRGATDILQAQGIRGNVVICCGKGNNGGDGLVMARHLANRNVPAYTLLFADPADLTPDCALQWKIVAALRSPAESMPGPSVDESRLKSLFQRADWIVDALFGTGLKGALAPPFDRIVSLINASGARVLAVDIPSGLDCDTGNPLGATIKAEHTATFVAPKVGFANPLANAYTGRVHVVDIGVAPFRAGAAG
jgi:NAD(P)H-hydrate epimerase